jgi:hypothetical protein
MQHVLSSAHNFQWRNTILILLSCTGHWHTYNWRTGLAYKALQNYVRKSNQKLRQYRFYISSGIITHITDWFSRILLPWTKMRLCMYQETEKHSYSDLQLDQPKLLQFGPQRSLQFERISYSLSFDQTCLTIDDHRETNCLLKILRVI